MISSSVNRLFVGPSGNGRTLQEKSSYSRVEIAQTPIYVSVLTPDGKLRSNRPSMLLNALSKRVKLALETGASDD